MQSDVITNYIVRPLPHGGNLFRTGAVATAGPSRRSSSAPAGSSAAGPSGTRPSPGWPNSSSASPSNRGDIFEAGRGEETEKEKEKRRCSDTIQSQRLTPGFINIKKTRGCHTVNRVSPGPYGCFYGFFFVFGPLRLLVCATRRPALGGVGVARGASTVRHVVCRGKPPLRPGCALTKGAENRPPL